jgi:hypothetical protein
MSTKTPRPDAVKLVSSSWHPQPTRLRLDLPPAHWPALTKRSGELVHGARIDASRARGP